MNTYYSRWVKLCLFILCFSATKSYAIESGTVEVLVTAEQNTSENVVVKLISWHDNGYTTQIVTAKNSKVIFENVPTGKFDVFIATNNGEKTIKAKGEVTENVTTPIALHLD